MHLDGFILFDGALGTMLQQHGLKGGEYPELLNLSNPEMVTDVHREYVLAGADVISTNTFGANSVKMGKDADIEKIVSAAVNCAKASGAKNIALDVGPTGAMLEPFGELSFEEAYNSYRQQISAGVHSGVDCIIIETMSDLLEAKAAVIAAKDTCSLPVIASMTYNESGKTFLGTDAVTATITLCALGVNAVGVNCSLGPDEMLPVITDILKYASVPVIVQANAGLPVVEDGRTVYPCTPDKYSVFVKKIIDMGVSVLGGCCGTTPEYISRIRDIIDEHEFKKRSVTPYTAFTSGRKAIIFNDRNKVIIGERINPTGKKKLKEALLEKNYSYVLNEALSQETAGADILDVNVGVPGIDEKQTLVDLVKEIQTVTPLPLQIDSSDPEALEAAVRIYNGKPIINSVNGKQESLDTVIPIAVKYGAAVIALTLDENGIPETAEGRLLIAKRILNKALDYGMKKEDVIIDCLVLTASTNQDEVLETINAIKLVKANLGLKTVLGVSNVSFGLPSREIINSVFLSAALGAGLDMPILNPLSDDYMQVITAYNVLSGVDKGADKYIKKFSDERVNTADSENDIKDIVFHGRKDLIVAATSEALKNMTAIDIINKLYIPALDAVGKKFESGLFFLPQLMASADTVKTGFEFLKLGNSHADTNNEKILLATVKGDIHDIGKNIVKMLLENYGYTVIDLGKDVSPELILHEAKEKSIRLIGLSALMTTTVVNMKKTITMLKNEYPECKVMVGGAVLTAEYAESIGADYYAGDAAEAVKIAKKVFDK